MRNEPRPWRFRWIPFLVLCCVAATVPSQGETASSDSTGTKAAQALSRDDSLRATVQVQQAVCNQIQSLLDGSLPEGFIVQSLFAVDLLDEPAVERRQNDLRLAIQMRNAELRGADSLLAAALHVTNRADGLRLQFLSRSATERERVNNAEQIRRALAREAEIATRTRQDAEVRATAAEEQRQSAIAEAQRPQSTVLEDLAQEMVRAQTMRAALARLEADLAQQRQSQAERASAAVEQILDLDKRLRASIAVENAVQVFNLSVTRQQTALSNLQAALTNWSAASLVPRASPDQRLMETTDPTVVDKVQSIRQLYDENAKASALIRAVERDVRWQTLDYEIQNVRALNGIRVRALEHLSVRERSRALGVGRAGLSQLRIEVRYLTLSARVHFATRLRNLYRVPDALRDVFKLGTAFYVLLRVSLVLALVAFARRRWTSIMAIIQSALMRNVRNFRDSRRVRNIVNMVRAAGPWLLFLVALRLLRGALGDTARAPELALLLRMALWYGAYRLTVSVLYASVVRIAMYYFPHLGSVTTLALLRSMRLLLGVVFVIGASLSVFYTLVGDGYLRHVLAQFAGFAVFATVLIILRSWRQEISDTYLRLAPAGRLATAVERTRNRWYGFSVGIMAFIWLAGRVLVVVSRDFALGFDQVRRALAFLFRRRMEKQAEARGYATHDIDSLPSILVQNFTDTPLTDQKLMVDHFPGIQEFEKALAGWRERGTSAQFLLIGERGMGKTSWLGRVKGAEGLRIDRCVLEDRVWAKGTLVEELTRQLFPEAEFSPRLSALRRALLEDEPRLVVLDMCQNLFLGMVGGYEGLEAFSELTNDTSSNVFWLCSCNSHAWRHLEAVRPDLSLFQHRQSLARWSEEGIGELIRTRMAASGVEVDFSELVLERFDPSTAENRVVGAEEAFIRLLWDFSDGNPRAAMHFWLRSLEAVSDSQVRVRLFRSPPAEELESTNEVAQFILAAVVLHENLTIKEASATTGYPVKLCRIHLNRFLETDILVNERGRYRVSTFWHRTLVRYLSRKNLLAD